MKLFRRASPTTFSLAAAAALIASLTVPFVASPSRAAEGGASVTETLYATSFKDLKDQKADLAQFKGKVMVMYFWATWCVPCRIETPNLVKLNDAYKAKGVEVVGIALDNGDKVRDFVKENNVTYSIFYGGHDAVVLGKALGNEGGAIPFTVVIDKAGKVVQTFKGDLPNSEIEKIINPLLG